MPQGLNDDAPAARRLRGWKRIAAHLGVTQSTAIRWSKSADFPVIKVENGSSVYADADQLDAWLAKRSQLPSEVPLPVQSVEAGSKRTAARSYFAWTAGVLAAFTVIVGLSHFSAFVWPNQKHRAMGDAALDSAYDAARTAWASRTPEGVMSSLDQFRVIVAKNPSYVPGLTGLADAHILSTEFANADRTIAFQDATNAAQAALAIDPEDGDANRIKGFLIYWRTRDIAEASPFFEKSIAAGSGNYLAFLWYGNALIDAGRVSDGIVKLDQAVKLSPESTAVATDHAIALWQSGDSKGALAELAAIRSRNPKNPVPYSFAAMFSLASGDLPQYLELSRQWAELVKDKRQAERIAAETRAYQAGGREAVLQLIARTQPIGNNPYWHGGNLPAAIAASLLGDREALAAILLRKTGLYDVSKEDWRPLRFPLEPFVKWKDDPKIGPLVLKQFRIDAFPNGFDASQASR